MGHQIATVQKDVSSYRTGSERALIGRMGKEFAQVAKGDGVVKEVTDTNLIVEYKDGTTDTFRIGSSVVNAEGTRYPHELKTMLKPKDKVKAGDLLYYNDGFFVPSAIEKNKVDYSLGLNAFVAFREANYTIEDSAAISENLSKRMGTQVIKMRTKVMEFDQEISQIVKVGDKVDLDTPLALIEDGFTSEMDKDELAQALKRYSSNIVRAGDVGVVSHIEVFYNGEIDDMSPSLKALTTKSENARRKLAKEKGEKFFPNKVERNVRIDGNQVEAQQAILVFHVTATLGMGVVDKLVFASQLKSTVGKVLFGENKTLEGEEIDSIFGALSGLNRMVLSVYKQGAVNTYLRYVGEEAYKMFTGKGK